MIISCYACIPIMLSAVTTKHKATNTSSVIWTPYALIYNGLLQMLIISIKSINIQSCFISSDKRHLCNFYDLSYVTIICSMYKTVWYKLLNYDNTTVMKCILLKVLSFIIIFQKIIKKCFIKWLIWNK